MRCHCFRGHLKSGWRKSLNVDLYVYICICIYRSYIHIHKSLNEHLTHVVICIDILWRLCHMVYQSDTHESNFQVAYGCLFFPVGQVCG